MAVFRALNAGVRQGLVRLRRAIGRGRRTNGVQAGIDGFGFGAKMIRAANHALRTMVVIGALNAQVFVRSVAARRNAMLARRTSVAFADVFALQRAARLIRGAIAVFKT